MRRREFLALAGAAVTAWPFTARAQRSPLPVIGWLSGGAEAAFGAQLAAYRLGLAEEGFVEGRNVAIEWRWTNGDHSKALGLLTDLIQRRVSVFSLSGGWGAGAGSSGPVAKALFASGIPAVTGFGRDPRRSGWVDSLSRPGGNLTGVNQQTQELEPKRLGLLHDVVPEAKIIAYLARPSTAITADLVKDAQDAAQRLGLRLVVFNADNPQEIDAAFAAMKALPADALIVSADPFFNTRRDQVVNLITALRLPAIGEWREFATGGALVSYGTTISATFRQIGAYTAAVLKGAKIADLPVVQNSTYQFVINLRTAKALGITVPVAMLAAADEVLE